jgi:hypothetical protein
MKTFLEYEVKSGLPTIYCDMDGVLVDFIRGAERANNGEEFKDTDQQWQRINQTKGHWKNLDWMPDGKKLWQFISKYNPHILSAYSKRNPQVVMNGKMDWLSKHNLNIPKAKIHLVLRSEKQGYALNTSGEPNLLIDDHTQNIKQFTARGGLGIYHKNTAETIKKLREYGYK